MKTLFSLLLILLTACQNKEVAHISGNAMTMEYRITFGTRLCLPSQKRAKQIIEQCFEEVDRIYNKWNPASELSALNQLPPHTKTPISQELTQLLALTDQVYRLTEGRFDPTIEPVLTAWKKALSHGKLPSEQELAPLACGWQKIHVLDGLFWKDGELALDLSGIAKGYAIDLLIERLQKELNISSLLIEWGGEIRAAGRHPEGRPWTIFISRFGSTEPQHAIDILPLQNQAIATSGDYLQNWRVDGITYSHIIDPRTKKPLIHHEKSISSASVVAPTCALADGLATAAMIFPTLEEAAVWAEKIRESDPEIHFWLAASILK
jgi:FAD:protein FMN transferase